MTASMPFRQLEFTVNDVRSEVLIGSGLASRLPDLLAPHEPDKILAVVDESLWSLCPELLNDALDGFDVPVDTLAVPGIEDLKSFTRLEAILEHILPRATRDSIIVAVGGSTVGNTVGTAAALLFRGTRFAHVPTTLMAQSDGAIGIKQAINAQYAKNAFGAYHTPLLTLNDTRFLATLPEADWRNGLSESAKVAVACDTAFADLLIDVVDPNDPRQMSDGDLVECIARTAAAKVNHLETDPYERNSLLFLEIGHTVGHALERATGGRVHHGQAIALGMLVEAEVCRRLGHVDTTDAADLLRHLLVDVLGHSDTLPLGVAASDVLACIRLDNRRRRDGPVYVLPSEPGSTIVTSEVPEEIVGAVLAEHEHHG